MTVKHIFSGVAKGSNSETKTKAAKGNDQALAMAAIGSGPGAVTIPDRAASAAGVTPRGYTSYGLRDQL